MSKRISVMLIVLLVTVCSLSAQQIKKAPKPRFHSLEQVALINGKAAVSASLQSVNGLGMGNWFSGLGVGLDFYRHRTVPLFLDVRKSFGGQNRNKLFVYADGGINVPWVKDSEPVFSIWDWPVKTDYRYKAGTYMDAGFGYAVRISGDNAILLSTGFSHKYFSEKRTTTRMGSANREVTDVQNYTYSLNRLMIKAGWQF